MIDQIDNEMESESTRIKELSDIIDTIEMNILQQIWNIGEEKDKKLIDISKLVKITLESISSGIDGNNSCEKDII